jgi:hypothetical protein
MFTHSDKEFEHLVRQLEQQRDYAMGQAAALYKDLQTLKSKMAETQQSENQNDNAI